ncbi:MAG: hypothetical protein ACYCX4_00285 [Bacillota bacterium]
MASIFIKSRDPETIAFLKAIAEQTPKSSLIELDDGVKISAPILEIPRWLADEVLLLRKLPPENADKKWKSLAIYREGSIKNFTDNILVLEDQSIQSLEDKRSHGKTVWIAHETKILIDHWTDILGIDRQQLIDSALKELLFRNNSPSLLERERNRKYKRLLIKGNGTTVWIRTDTKMLSEYLSEKMKLAQHRLVNLAIKVYVRKFNSLV